jgi:hypothetical protein
VSLSQESLDDDDDDDDGDGDGDDDDNNNNNNNNSLLTCLVKSQVTSKEKGQYIDTYNKCTINRSYIKQKS